MWVLLVLLLAGLGLQDQACADQERDRRVLECIEPCVSGKCVAPDECQCLSGHQFVNGSRTVCEPICSKNCGANSFCSAPETCACNEGYVFVNGSSTDCEPLCSRRCINGICSGPDMCTCLEGFGELLWYYCVPLCPKHCLNGNCRAPNRCICYTGYRPSPTHGSSVCEPICSRGCGHGRCIAPEICLCDEGYSKLSAGWPCEVKVVRLDSGSGGTINGTNLDPKDTDTN